MSFFSIASCYISQTVPFFNEWYIYKIGLCILIYIEGNGKLDVEADYNKKECRC